MAFCGLFWPKNVFFLVMGPLKPLIICSKTWQSIFSWVQHPEHGVWGPTTDHSGPKNTVLGYIMAFLAIFGQKMRFFFVMVAPKHLIMCFKTLQSPSL